MDARHAAGARRVMYLTHLTRRAALSDEAAIRSILLAAFPTGAEADLVDALRDSGDLAISLVAEVDGEVVGCLALSSVNTTGGAPGVGVGPLAVAAGFRKRGIGGALVRFGLAQAMQGGFGWAVVLGDPGYYRGFGFEPASQFGIRDEFGGGSAFQAIELVDGALPRGAGLVRYAPAFNGLLDRPCPELRTERLLMRCWGDADKEPFAVINGDPEVMEFLGGPLSRESSGSLVDSIMARFAEQGFGLWALEPLAGGRTLVGFAGLNVPSFDAPFMPAVEVGWRLARPYWGCGFATEAAAASLEFGFTTLGLDEVVSFAVPANKRSVAVMERLGMRRDPDADFDHPRIDPGSPLRRHVLYRITARDWARRVKAGQTPLVRYTRSVEGPAAFRANPDGRN